MVMMSAILSTWYTDKLLIQTFCLILCSYLLLSTIFASVCLIGSLSLSESCGTQSEPSSEYWGWSTGTILLTVFCRILNFFAFVFCRILFVP